MHSPASGELQIATGFKRDLCYGVVLAIVILLTYRPAWDGTPIFDDAMHIPKPADRSLVGLAQTWVKPTSNHQYHPLVDTVFWVETRLFNQHMFGYHFVNILLHAAAAFLLLRVLRRLWIPGACLAATLFALHPLQVESVAFLAEMKNTLSAVCLFAALLAYRRFDREARPKWYWLAWLFFAAGLFAKGSTAYLPIIVLIINWWRRRKLEWRRAVRPMLPFFAVGVVAATTTVWFERRIAVTAGTGPAVIPFLDRLLIAGRAFWFYVAKIFLPINLKMFYPRWEIDPTVWWQYLFPAAAIVLLLVAWASRNRSRGLWAGLVFLLLTLLPFLGFFDMRMFRFQFVSEHLGYLSILGILVPLSAGVAMTVARWDDWRRYLIQSVMAVALGLLVIQSWRHSEAFRDAETCYRDSIAHGGYNWIAHLNLAVALIGRSQWNAAELHLRKALQLNPPEGVSVSGIHMNLGQVLRQQCNPHRAAEEFRKSIELWPNFRAYDSLAGVLYEAGNLHGAVASYRKAMELAPDSPAAMTNTAWILATAADGALRDGPKALRLALRADKLSRGADPFALRALGAAYAETRDYPKAIETAKRAQRLATEIQLRQLANQLQFEIALFEAGRPVRERVL